MAREWVDFKKVKEAVDIQMVLDHYGIKGLTKSGDELRGPFPIHKGSQRSKHFTVNVRKNAFNCFSKDCGTRGNVLDLVAAIENCSVRDAALKLQDWFKIGESPLRSPKQGEVIGQRPELQRGIYRDEKGGLYELVINAASSEDFEPLVVYRELFGDYQFWVGSPQLFTGLDANGESSERQFTLVSER
jgi:hypothetical protein